MSIKDLEFEVIQESGGSYAATCHDRGIYAKGVNLEELHANLTASIADYFGDEDQPNPENVKLVVYKEG